MSTQRTEEQKLNPKPCKVGHCDNMCYCTEDKTTTDESVVDWEKEFDKHFKPTDSHMDGLFWYSSEQEATKEVKDFIRSLLTSKDAQHKAEVEKAVREENERIKDWVTTVLFTHPELKDEIISFLTTKES